MFKSRPLFDPTDSAFANAINGGAGGTGGAPAGGNASAGGNKPGATSELEVLRARLAETELKYQDIQAKATTLESNWNAAQTLLKPNADPTTTESAFRTAMAAAGYSVGEIEQQLASYRSGGETEEEAPAPQQRGTRKNEVDPEIAALNQKFDFLRQQQEQQAAQNTESRKTQLKTLMDQTIQTSLDTSVELGTLVKKLASLDSDPKSGEASRRTVLADELRDTTLRRLRQRRDQNGGNWSDAWVLEESKRASQEVAAKYRAVIGDPSRIGRVTETDSGDLLAQRPAVKPAEYQKGMTPEGARQKVEEWAVDSLLRGAVPTNNAI
jgi:hypothetical protein